MSPCSALPRAWPPLRSAHSVGCQLIRGGQPLDHRWQTEDQSRTDGRLLVTDTYASCKATSTTSNSRWCSSAVLCALLHSHHCIWHLRTHIQLKKKEKKRNSRFLPTKAKNRIENITYLLCLAFGIYTHPSIHMRCIALRNSRHDSRN